MNFLRPIGKFFVNWASEMSVLLFTIASIMGASALIYLITWRAPQQDMTWLLDQSANCVAIALAITFTSVAREAFGYWFTTKDMLTKPAMAAIQAASSLTIFLACLYKLSH